MLAYQNGAAVDGMLRLAAAWMCALLFLFVLNAYWVYWHGWANLAEAPLLRLLGFGALLIGIAALIWRTPARALRDDANWYARAAAYLIRAAYWAVLLIGLCDMLISFLRVEGLLDNAVGRELATQLGRPTFRGIFVHYPLLIAALVIAWFSKSLGFIWLAMWVVLAEFQVVVSRFVFSYEQAFMGDLVRFWYAALFLFAAAYTLSEEGHVRVDVLYAGFSRRAKAIANAGGAVLLGLPVCWTILICGMAGKGASITSPLLAFEISQSGYGMYVKYLMAGFLLVFALSMALQFISAFLDNAAVLRGKE